MKNLNYLLFSTILLASACSSSDTNTATEKTEIKAENIVVADFAIEGMVCAMGCAKTIEEEVLGMNGVAASLVDYETGKAHFEYDKTQLTEKDIIAKIEGLADGQYKVGEWKEEVENTGNAEQNSSEKSNVTTEDKSKVSVKLPSFQIPNLFTFLVNRV
jgi:copper chaperone CopZ